MDYFIEKEERVSSSNTTDQSIFYAYHSPKKSIAQLLILMSLQKHLIIVVVTRIATVN